MIKIILTMSAENIRDGFECKDDFNPDPIRNMLGLGGAEAFDLPLNERIRLANILHRAGYITPDEVEKLGMKIRKVNGPVKGVCTIHSEWYFDGIACTHADHLPNDEKNSVWDFDVYRDRPRDR